jgi:hypothetical protein
MVCTFLDFAKDFDFDFDFFFLLLDFFAEPEGDESSFLDDLFFFLELLFLVLGG